MRSVCIAMAWPVVRHHMLGLVLLVLSLAALCSAKKEQVKLKSQSGTKELVDQMLTGYFKQDPPKINSPNEVKLGIFVNSFYSINEQTMDYSVNFYLRQSWNDPRLTWERKPPHENLKEIKLENDMWQKIWIPDTFFRNEKKANFHEVTVSNRLLKLQNNGDLFYVTKISAVFSCPMQLQSYPLDTQVCPLMFESFGYTMDTMYFAWMKNTTEETVTFEVGQKTLPQFTVVDTKTRDCSQSYVAGNFTCAEVRFVLKRDIGFFMIQVYVPSILIVILSWVSFWINMESSPARVSIGLLTVLTTTTMSGSARATLPKVSYIKAIDVWMIVCLVFVFSSLIEYAVVNVMARKQGRPRKPPVPPGTGPVPAGPGPAVGGLPNLPERRGTGGPNNCSTCVCVESCRRTKSVPAISEADVGKRKARQIDKFSRKFFPLAFVLFNIVYWMVYAIPTDAPTLPV